MTCSPGPFDPLTTGFEMARVLSARLPMLALAAAHPSASRQSEMVRMVTEKQLAWADGLLGAQQAWLAAWMTGRFDLHQVAREVSDAAGAPALRTLRGNARRLARRKRL